MSVDVNRVRADFPTLKRDIRGRPLVYLDNAASTLKPLKVIERIDRYYRNETSNIHRGAHFLGEQGTVAYERAREIVLEFIGAEHMSEVIFTRGTTESINLVAQSFGRLRFQAGDEILLTEMEHHSNIVPWQLVAQERGCTVKAIPVTDAGELDLEAFQRMLNPRVKMVALTWCSNTLGTINPVKEIIRLAHANGAAVLLDAAQAVAHIPINVRELGCDFLAFSGHKVFGPYGIGVLYGRHEHLEKMPPYQGGGSMISEVSFENTTYAESPHKFEAGTPSIADAIGLGAALEYLQAIGVENAAKYEAGLLAHATALLEEIPGLRVIGQAREKTAVLSFVIDGIHPSDIGSLVDQEGIAVRAGHHCTQPLMRRLGIPATARASFSLYNTMAEAEALQKALLKIKEFF